MIRDKIIARYRELKRDLAELERANCNKLDDNRCCDAGKTIVNRLMDFGYWLTEGIDI